MSTEVKNFLNSQGIASSRTTPYNPRGNGQVERLNGTLWKAIQLALRSSNRPIEQWEQVLPQALNSIRSLLCTATHCTPHERMFTHTRRSTNGVSIPTWLTQSERVLMRKFNRVNKYQPIVEEVELLHVNPDYSYVRLADGRESTVSNRHLAPLGQDGQVIQKTPEVLDESRGSCDEDFFDVDDSSDVEDHTVQHQSDQIDDSDSSDTENRAVQQESRRDHFTEQAGNGTPRRSTRQRRLPSHLHDYDLN